MVIQDAWYGAEHLCFTGVGSVNPLTLRCPVGFAASTWNDQVSSFKTGSHVWPFLVGSVTTVERTDAFSESNANMCRGLAVPGMTRYPASLSTVLRGKRTKCSSQLPMEQHMTNPLLAPYLVCGLAAYGVLIVLCACHWVGTTRTHHKELLMTILHTLAHFARRQGVSASVVLACLGLVLAVGIPAPALAATATPATPTACTTYHVIPHGVATPATVTCLSHTAGPSSPMDRPIVKGIIW